MKKFKEFIKLNEDVIPNSVFDVLSVEEVEYQFLRIKEVFGCKLIIECKQIGDFSFGKRVLYKSYLVLVRERLGTQPELAERIYTEFDQIKRRMESMYPQLEIVIHKYNQSNSYDTIGTYAGVVIHLKPYQI